MNRAAIGLLTGFLSVSLVGCGTESSGDAAAGSGNTAKAQAEQAAETQSTPDNNPAEGQQQEYSVGDTIEKNGKAITVSDVQRSPGAELDKPQEGNEYVIVTVDIQNQGNETVSYDPFNYQIQNAQGQITDHVFTMVHQDTALNSGELASGDSVSGTIAFQVPKDSSNSDLTLLIKSSMSSNDNTKVNLAAQ